MTRVRHDIHTAEDIPGPSAASTSTQLRLTDSEEAAIAELVGLIGRLRRRDLAIRSRQGRNPGKDALAERKRSLTAETSSRWAGSIVRGNDAQHALAVRGQQAHLADMRKAIATIDRRAAVRCGSFDASKAKKVRGYRTPRERAMKLRRRDALAARCRELEADLAAGIVHIVEGGKALARKRQNLDAAGLDERRWREAWDAERSWVQANGSKGEPFGNLTITVAPDGACSIRLPRALEHLANAPRGRLLLEAPAIFRHRGDERAAQAAAGRAISYRIRRMAGRPGWYLDASWTIEPEAIPDDGGRILGVDLNADHLAGWVLDRTGSPVGPPITVPLELSGPSSTRDAAIRHALRTLIREGQRRGSTAIAVENLDFADARAAGRETMGSGARGRRFRRTVAGMPTGIVRSRLRGMACRAGMRLIAVAPAYTSKWGAEHWLDPLKDERQPHDVTQHHSAAVVIGRRAMGLSARRRPGGARGDRRIADARASGHAGRSEAARGRGPRGSGASDGRAPTTSGECRSPRRATATPAGRRHRRLHSK